MRTGGQDWATKKNYQKLVSFKSGYSEELEVALWSDVEDFFKAEPPLLVPLLSSLLLPALWHSMNEGLKQLDAKIQTRITAPEGGAE